eukprot:scaffold33083_cov129-Isochrysis_galbana.AAC.3
MVDGQGPHGHTHTHTTHDPRARAASSWHHGGVHKEMTKPNSYAQGARGLKIDKMYALARATRFGGEPRA